MAVDLDYLVAEDGPKVFVLARDSSAGDARSPTRDRKPVNLALAIDRSSSMRGPRIAQAKSAARQLLERLDERDRFALVVFDGAARLAFGPENLSGEARQRAVAALDELRTGLGTNLAAGWKKAADAVSSGFVRDAVARVVLLTDGQPSVGITDATRLAELAGKEATRGVSTTAMGIGEGFDDELLAEIARRGRGGFYYLATPESIPAAFGNELAGVFSIVATEAELKLMPDAEVVAAELVHRLPSRPVADGLTVELGEIAAGPARQILFQLHRDAASSSRRLGTLMLTYRATDGTAGDGHILGIERPSLAMSEATAIVTLERLRLEVARAVDEAWARRGLDNRVEASGALIAMRRQIERARNEKRANPDALEDLVREIELAEKALARGAAEREKARRGMRERSQLTLLGRSTVRPLPEPDSE